MISDQKSILILKLNQLILGDELVFWLSSSGYERSEIALEVGEFAIRGSIIDIVTYEDKGFRLDLLGNELDRIREFDPYTQLSYGGKLTEITLFPINSEVSNKESAPRRILTPIEQDSLINHIAALNIGDIVVHKDHGIGKFLALETITTLGITNDFIKLEYSGGDFLFVPVSNLDLISRYGSSGGDQSLDRLGTAAWQARKASIKKRIGDLAGEIVKIAAARHAIRTAPIIPDSDLYAKFCRGFPYLETEDQSRAIGECLADLASGGLMDRLVCGDVGFGKTEVAMRAAFVVASDAIKRQVAIIVPTTLLARQHYQNFLARFNGFRLNIKMLSRSVSIKDAIDIKKNLHNGEIDIIIGTHALLAKNITFHNLGLVILDEEQHFGVAAKEKLKKASHNLHLLTLSATPIPRTLQMSLTGLRELSMITTAPAERVLTKTVVVRYNEALIREGVLREHRRGGQMFFVVPRIKDIDKLLPRLTEILPEITIGVAHGQMPQTKLEQIMNDFYDGKIEMLLSTKIVESGLDIAMANSIFIYQPEHFGLAELYQLRGRVGRSKLSSFAYFLHKDSQLTSGAKKRLQVIASLDRTGSGFILAASDLDIRGAGNLLGDEQSGHVKEVGLELYQELLANEMARIRGEKDLSEAYSPQIKYKASAIIPADYIAENSLRIEFYRRIAAADTEIKLQSLKSEMEDRFGIAPASLCTLFLIAELKQLACMANVEKVEIGDKHIIISFHNEFFAQPDQLIAMITRRQGKLLPASRIQFQISNDNRLTDVKIIMNELCNLQHLS